MTGENNVKKQSQEQISLHLGVAACLGANLDRELDTGIQDRLSDKSRLLMSH